MDWIIRATSSQLRAVTVDQIHQADNNVRKSQCHTYVEIVSVIKSNQVDQQLFPIPFLPSFLDTI